MADETELIEHFLPEIQKSIQIPGNLSQEQQLELINSHPDVVNFRKSQPADERLLETTKKLTNFGRVINNAAPLIGSLQTAIDRRKTPEQKQQIVDDTEQFKQEHPILSGTGQAFGFGLGNVLAYLLGKGAINKITGAGKAGATESVMQAIPGKMTSHGYLARGATPPPVSAGASSNPINQITQYAPAQRVIWAPTGGTAAAATQPAGFMANAAGMTGINLADTALAKGSELSKPDIMLAALSGALGPALGQGAKGTIAGQVYTRMGGNPNVFGSANILSPAANYILQALNK